MLPSADTKISIVIPCYRSENTIQQVVNDIELHFRKNHHHNYEIILINDHSPDDVYHVIQQLAKQNPHIHGASLSKNFGQHAAKMLGYRKSVGAVVISMDDDGETPADDIFTLIDALDEKTDVVYAQFNQNPRGILRAIGTKFNHFMARFILGLPKNIKPSSFFAMNQKTTRAITAYQLPNPYTLGLVLRQTKHIKNVCIDIQPRINGESGYSMRALIRLWLDGLFLFPIQSLRLVIICVVPILFNMLMIGLLTYSQSFFHLSQTLSVLLAVLTMILVIESIVLPLILIFEYIHRLSHIKNNTPQYIIQDETP